LSYDPATLLALLAWGTLVGLDLVSGPQIMIARPLVAGTVAGALAGDALDMVKNTLMEMRDAKYRTMFNSPNPEQKLRLMDELKAIEALAQALLAKEARGELAHKQLMGMVGHVEERVAPSLLKPERTPARKRSARSRRAAAK